MLQFYFLSILLNLVTGLILYFVDSNGQESVSETKIPPIVYDETFRLILGILTAVTGLFKLLSAVRGDVPVVGDLLPALAGLIGGFVILYEYYKNRSRDEVENVNASVFFQKMIAGKKYIGIVCMVAAICHFLFPTVLFL